MEIKTVKEFIGTLRQGKYTSVGSYPVFFYTADGGVFSFESARENVFQIARAIRDKNDKQWEVIGADVNWEDPSLFCDDTGERIQSAYAEDEANEMWSRHAAESKDDDPDMLMRMGKPDGKCD